MVHQLLGPVADPLLIGLAIGTALRLLHTVLAFVGFLIVAKGADDPTRLAAYRLLLGGLRPLARLANLSSDGKAAGS